jgi:hypothetical protein
MDAWELGKFQMLIEDNIRVKEAALTFKQGTMTPDLSKALVPSDVRDEPIIYPCCPVVPTPAPREPDPVRRINSLVDNDHGDILVRGFWARRTDYIFE